jgi:hypothetical protein
LSGESVARVCRDPFAVAVLMAISVLRGQL